ncbi:MAG: hypothetical protein EOL89_13100 [Actinobacteria bacterium]|nr:hypothetical protein [Actinomycetota bacterium]
MARVQGRRRRRARLRRRPHGRCRVVCRHRRRCPRAAAPPSPAKCRRPCWRRSWRTRRCAAGWRRRTSWWSAVSP